MNRSSPNDKAVQPMLFIEQIRAGQPITVTEPKMTRFLMLLARPRTAGARRSPRVDRRSANNVRRRRK
jgi:hypothetical protein